MALRSSTLVALALAAAVGTWSRAAGAQQVYPDTTKADTTKPPPPPPPKPSPGPQFSGWLFGDFQYQTDSARKAANGGKSPNQFDLGRAYFTVVAPVGPHLSVRLTTDLQAYGGTGDPFFGKGLVIRIKYGYLNWNFIDQKKATDWAAFARIGVLHTVIIDYEERFWPRYLQQTAVEKNGFMSSSDLGVAANFTIVDKLGEIYATIVNGNGYTNLETDRFKDFAIRFAITPFGRSDGLFSTFAITPWVSDGGNRSKFFNGDSTGAPPITDKLEKNRWGIFVGNRDPRLTFAFEYAQKKDDNENAALTEDARVVTNVTGDLTDGFIIVRPTAFKSPTRSSNLGIVFRYDHWVPNNTSSSAQNFYIFGVFFEPSKTTAVAIDYQNMSPANGNKTPQQSTWFFHWQALFP